VPVPSQEIEQSCICMSEALMFASICTNCKQNLKDFGQCGFFFSILSTFVVFGMFLKCLGMGLVMSYL
jgi:hypothetical protein